MCIDSNVKQEFTFTPSFSLFITCDSEEEINRLYENLTDGGRILMPLDNHGFSKKFGVSWQLNLPN
jgi:predicted 3-demethylubiquinone-9 3-methyltransferase (glyoxalase superfamily)